MLILQKQSFGGVLQPEACNFIKKETLAQVFSCEICKIFKNNFFDRIPKVAASDSKSSIIHLMYNQHCDNTTPLPNKDFFITFSFIFH